MSSSISTPGAAAEPNHHAHHPGFAGVGGVIAALTFLIGRGAVADLAVELADIGPLDDVVDVGCGPGVAIRHAIAAGPASVTGIDPAPVMLRFARVVTQSSRGGAPAVRYLDGAAEAMPIADDSASVLWSLATVHHWHDLEAGLREARRVLRPTGRLLAIERRVEAGASGHASHGWTEEQAQLFATRCSTAGFANVEVGHHRPGSRKVISVLAKRH